jgi:hypothetical protein
MVVVKYSPHNHGLQPAAFFVSEIKGSQGAASREC